VDRQNLHPAIRSDPKALFRATRGISHGTLTIVTPDPVPGQRAEQADVASVETKLLPHALGGEGHSSVGSAIGTCVLC